MPSSKSPELLRPGVAAPDFSLNDHHGKPVSLADFADKRVLLWFYPKADTPG